MKKSDEPIIVEHTYDTPADTVWSAINDIDRMRQWYFDDIPAFEPDVGFTTRFDVHCEDRVFKHMWKVTEVEPLQKIAYDWKFENYPGDSIVVFELLKNGHLTKLKVTCHILDDFPEDVPEFSRESCMEGWTFFIKKKWKDYLEKTIGR